MTLREEEQIREQLMLLQYRNSSSPYKLNRLWKRYMKCIQSDTSQSNTARERDTFNHTKKESQNERTKKKRQT